MDEVIKDETPAVKISFFLLEFFSMANSSMHNQKVIGANILQYSFAMSFSNKLDSCRNNRNGVLKKIIITDASTRTNTIKEGKIKTSMSPVQVPNNLSFAAIV